MDPKEQNQSNGPHKLSNEATNNLIELIAFLKELDEKQANMSEKKET